MGSTFTFLRVAFACLSTLLVENFCKAQDCTVNAGLPEQYCNVTTFNLSGKSGGSISGTPNIQWTQVGGSPALTISSPNTLNTSVTNVVPGVFVFRLSIQCADGNTNFNDVSITVLPPPTIALAGPDQQVCATGGITLAGNNPAAGEIGTWAVVSGGGSITNPNSPSATFNAPGSGSFQLVWTIDNGSCFTSDTVIINVLGGTQPVNAGGDITLTCSGTATSLSGSDPGLPPQSGLWTFVSGPGIPIIQSPASSNTSVTGLIVGDYVFRWTVSGPCFSGSDEVTVTVTDTRTSPNTGGNKSQTFCQADGVTQVLLIAAPMAAGETGQWTQTAGPAATIVSPNAATTQVTDLNGTSQYTFVWTVTNTGGCVSTANHRLVFVPDLNSLTTPTDQILACQVHSTTVNLQYDYSGVTTGTGLTRNAVLLASPLSDASGVKFERSGPIGDDTWTITGMDSAGLYAVRFEYRNSCDAVFRTIGILVSDTGATSNAGADIVLPCNELTTTLVAADIPPGQGNGEWSQVSGPPASIQNPLQSTTQVTVTLAGTYEFRWSISNGPACTSQTNEIIVQRSPLVIDSINAGPDTSFCSGISYTMQALAPPVASQGTWSNFPGGITISDINDPNAVISNLPVGDTVEFIWTVTNACDSRADTVLISATSSFGIQANAGPDQCLAGGTTSVQLTGNDPGSGISLWTSLDGATVNNPFQQNTSATIPSNGTYRFVYNIQSPGCGINSDTVFVTVSLATTVADAGPDQPVCVATLPASITLNGNISIIGTGLWTQVAGSAGPVIVNPNQAQTQVNNVGAGTYQFAYTISNGACNSTSDTVIVSVAASPGTVDAGPDQDLCSITTGTQVPLNATPVTNGSGIWTVASGPGGSAPIFSDATSPTSTVRNLQNGTYVLQWTTVSGPGCPVFSDQVSLNVSAQANANSTSSGACDVTSVTLTGNLNTTGVWSQVSGPSTATFTVVNGFTSTASNLVTGVYVFNYSLPAVGACPTSNDDVTVTISESPTVANAGADIELCPLVTTTDITGNTPTIGTPSWSRISGPNTPTETNTNTPTLSLSGLVPGVYQYRYSITNGTCPVSTDDVSVIVANVATAGNDTSACGAASIPLQGNVPVFYPGTWTQVSGPNTATFSNASSPTSTADNLVPGTYVFRWTISTPILCGLNNDDVSVHIDPALDITGLAGTDQSVCEGGSAITIGSPSGPPLTTYLWTPATFLSDPNSLQTQFTGAGAGVYTYTLTGTRGSCVAADQVTITVGQVPVQPVLSAPSNICENATTTVAVVSVQTGVTYNWSGGLGSGNSKVVGPGTYTVTPVFDAGGCAGPPANITIIGDQLPTTANAGTDQDLCQDITTTTLTGNITIIGDPLWSQLNGPNTASISPGPANRIIDIGSLVSGNYTFEYRITNGTCPPSTDQVVIRKETVANAGSDQRACNITSANLSANTPLFNTGTWTQVSKPATAPDATIVSPNSPSTVVNGLATGTGLSGDYVFRWSIAGNGCISNTDDITITIDAAVAKPNAGSNVTKCEDDASPVNLGSAPEAGLTYSWSPTTDLANPNASQTSFTGIAPGRFVYVLTATNGSCSNRDTVVVTINATPETPVISAPAAACTNGTATATITNADSTVDYTWREGTTIVANGITVELAPGTYVVTPTSQEGCVGPTGNLTLIPNAPPVADFTITPDGCRIFYTAVDAGPGVSYQFYFAPDANPSNATGPGPHLISYPTTGVKVTYMLAEDAGGCRDTVSHLSTVTCRSFPVPLNLLNFDGYWTAEYPLLIWRFEQSSDMSHFEIQRSSNGANFVTIGNMPIVNTPNLQEYRYTDSTAIRNGQSWYYRLKIVENTGVITYSRIVRLVSESLLTVRVSPNPFVDVIRVLIFSEEVLDAKIALVSSNGSLVKRQEAALLRGSNTIEITNLSMLAQGVYFLQVQTAKGTQVIRMQKM